MDFSKLKRRFEGTFPDTPADTIEFQTFRNAMRAVRYQLQQEFGRNRRMTTKSLMLVASTIQDIYGERIHARREDTRRNLDKDGLEAHREQLLKIVLQAVDEYRFATRVVTGNGNHPSASTNGHGPALL